MKDIFSKFLFATIPLLILLLAPATTFAAPAPWGIAFNIETQQCAGYWAGDEFTAYPLPEGWVDFYPDFNEGDAVINTTEGYCTFDSEESCCEQLGFEYVSDNIGIEEGNPYDDLPPGSVDPAVTISLLAFSCCCAGGIIALVVLIVVLLLGKEKAKNHNK